MRTLLKVPKKAELGLLIMSELAQRHSDGRPVSLEEIAEKSGASRKFLEQIAGTLRRAGLVEGRRGAAGGYVLAREPRLVTVAEVLAAVGGPMEKDVCTAHAHGRREQAIWSKVHGQIVSTLMSTTVADLV